MQKMGWFGAVRSHSRSSAMSPFDREHTTSSYSTLIEIMRLSCTVFEKQPVICRKSPTSTHPTCIWRHRGGDLGRILRRSMGSENQPPWAIVWCCLCDPTFSRFSRTPTCDGRTDGQTHEQTQGHGQYRGCIALRGKNGRKANTETVNRTGTSGIKPILPVQLGWWRNDQGVGPANQKSVVRFSALQCQATTLGKFFYTRTTVSKLEQLVYVET